MNWLFIWMMTVFCQETKAIGVPNLEDIFEQQQIAQWRSLLPKTGKVRVDLRPLLHDFGYLSPGQSEIGFKKFLHRYRVKRALIHNSQSDTNYGWLDVYLKTDLEDLRSGRHYQVIFSIQFKITASRWTVNQWVIQDVY